MLEKTQAVHWSTAPAEFPTKLALAWKEVILDVQPSQDPRLQPYPHYMEQKNHTTEPSQLKKS